MIKVYTSYFYQVRNMREGCLAFSTALSDPAWFRGTPHLDKNGVMIGLRAEPFVPRLSNPDICHGPKDCEHRILDLPWDCPFIEEYIKFLATLDPQNIEERFLSVGQRYLNFIGKDIPLTYILLVHEAPTNPCSERGPLQKWLKEHDMGGEEWNKDLR